MGKASERRKSKQQLFLSMLAQENPEKFKREWGKRLKSWTVEISFLAKDGKLNGQSVFSIVDRAKDILLGCGKKAVESQYKETQAVLENACCRALAPHIGYEMYRMNQRWKPDK
ncbi:MAG: hypothetical protein M1381_10865 [Deltaproteobacteria bacterium]|nr:hypothetical protein [Deltaproteobacteria bacterium]